MKHAVLVLLTVVVVGATARAQLAPLTITDAVADADSGTLTISGTGLGSRPLVTLNLIPLDVQLSIETRLMAAVPISAMPPGTYLLTISRGPAPADNASRPVSLGPSILAATAAAPPSSQAALSSPASSDTAAIIGDRTLTVSDIDREWQRTDPSGYFALMRGLDENRRRVANAMVTDALLAREAAARGITTEALLAEEIPKRTIPMPDGAVTSLYLSLGDRVRGATIDQLRPALRAWLARNTEPELAKMTYVEELMKTSTRAEVRLSAPRVDVALTPDDPTLGPPTAPVVIVVFGDLQSTEYVRYVPAFERVRDMFGNRLRIAFKHLPTFGPASTGVAQAAACAHVQGKFWAYHDAAAKPGSLDNAHLKSLASDVGLDRRVFDACVDGGAFSDLPRKALEEARSHGISASPAFLVNGRMAPESPAFLPPVEYFKRLIEEELQRQGREASGR